MDGKVYGSSSMAQGNLLLPAIKIKAVCACQAQALLIVWFSSGERSGNGAMIVRLKKRVDQEALDHSNNYIIITITHCDSNDTFKGPTTTLTWTAILVSSNIDLDYPFQIFAPHFKFISSQKNWKALFALYLGKAILSLRSQNLRCDLTLKSCNFTMV